MSRRGALVAAARFVGSAPPPPEDPLKQALLAFWPFTEASGPALDASGHGRTAAIVGSPARTDDGAAGRVMVFTGSGALTIPAAIVGTLPRWAMLARFATTFSGAQNSLYRESQASSGAQSGIYLNDTGQAAMGGGGYGATSTAAFNDGTYHTLLGQRVADTQFMLYVDGVKVGEHLFGGDDSAASRDVSTIGAERIFGGTYFNFTGKLQCLALFNRALTAGEIAELTAAPRARLT